MRKIHKTRRLFQRSVALFTAGLFLFNFIPVESLYALETSSISPEVHFQNSPPASALGFPSAFGTVEHYVPAKDASLPFILNIQDAHANASAQNNIARILEWLARQNPGETERSWVLAQEGTAGTLHPEYLQFFKNHPEVNDFLVEDLVRKGELTGAELFGWREFQKSGAVKSAFSAGTEEAALYRENLKIYREFLDAGAGYEKIFKNLRVQTGQLENNTLSKEARAYLTERRRRKDGDYGTQHNSPQWLTYLSYLKPQLESRLKLDLDDRFEQVRFPNVVRFNVLMQTGQEAAQGKIQKDREAFLSVLKARLRSSGEKEVLQLLETRPAGTNLRTAAEKAWKMAAVHGLNPRDYPGMWISLGKDILASEINFSGMEQEMTRLEEWLEESLAPSAKEKDVFKLGRDLELFNKLMTLELTRGQWEKIQTEGPAVSSRVLALADPETAELLKKLWDKAFRFYELAHQRDRVLVENTLRASQNKKLAVLITGGFHTEGIAQLLREKGAGYAVIQPGITDLDHGDNYRKVLRGENTDVSAYFPERYLNKQEALFFKAIAETGAARLAEKGRISGTKIAGEVAEALNSHPVFAGRIETRSEVTSETASRIHYSLLPLAAKNPDLTDQTVGITPPTLAVESYSALSSETQAASLPASGYEGSADYQPSGFEIRVAAAPAKTPQKAAPPVTAGSRFESRTVEIPGVTPGSTIPIELNDEAAERVEGVLTPAFTFEEASVYWKEMMKDYKRGKFGLMEAEFGTQNNPRGLPESVTFPDGFELEEKFKTSLWLWALNNAPAFLTQGRFNDEDAEAFINLLLLETHAISPKGFEGSELEADRDVIWHHLVVLTGLWAKSTEASGPFAEQYRQLIVSVFAYFIGVLNQVQGNIIIPENYYKEKLQDLAVQQRDLRKIIASISRQWNRLREQSEAVQDQVRELLFEHDSMEDDELADMEALTAQLDARHQEEIGSPLVWRAAINPVDDELKSRAWDDSPAYIAETVAKDKNLILVTDVPTPYTAPEVLKAGKLSKLNFYRLRLYEALAESGVKRFIFRDKHTQVDAIQSWLNSINRPIAAPLTDLIQEYFDSPRSIDEMPAFSEFIDLPRQDKPLEVQQAILFFEELRRLSKETGARIYFNAPAHWAQETVRGVRTFVSVHQRGDERLFLEEEEGFASQLAEKTATVTLTRGIKEDDVPEDTLRGYVMVSSQVQAIASGQNRVGVHDSAAVPVRENPALIAAAASSSWLLRDSVNAWLLYKKNLFGETAPYDDAVIVLIQRDDEDEEEVPDEAPETPEFQPAPEVPSDSDLVPAGGVRNENRTVEIPGVAPGTTIPIELPEYVVGYVKGLQIRNFSNEEAAAYWNEMLKDYQANKLGDLEHDYDAGDSRGLPDSVAFGYYDRDKRQNLWLWAVENFPALLGQKKLKAGEIEDFKNLIALSALELREEDLEDPQEEQGVIWYHIAYFTALQGRLKNEQGPLAEDYRELAEHLFKLFAAHFYITEGEQRVPADFYKERLVNLAISQAELRPVISEISRKWNSLVKEGAAFANYLRFLREVRSEENYIERTMDEEKNPLNFEAVASEAFRSQQDAEQILAWRAAMVPDEETAEAWDHSLDFLAKKIFPGKDLVVLASNGAFSQMPEKKEGSRLKKMKLTRMNHYRLRLLETLAESGIKRWIFDPGISGLLDIEVWLNSLNKPSARPLIEEVQEYLDLPKSFDQRASLSEFLLLPQGEKPPGVEQALLYFEELLKVKQAAGAEVFLTAPRNWQEDVLQGTETFILMSAAYNSAFSGKDFQRLAKIEKKTAALYLDAGRKAPPDKVQLTEQVIRYNAQEIAVRENREGDYHAVGIPIEGNVRLIPVIQTAENDPLLLPSVHLSWTRFKKESFGKGASYDSALLIVIEGDDDEEDSESELPGTDDFVPNPQDLVSGPSGLVPAGGGSRSERRNLENALNEKRATLEASQTGLNFVTQNNLGSAAMPETAREIAGQASGLYHAETLAAELNISELEALGMVVREVMKSAEEKNVKLTQVRGILEKFMGPEFVSKISVRGEANQRYFSIADAKDLNDDIAYAIAVMNLMRPEGDEVVLAVTGDPTAAAEKIETLKRIYGNTFSKLGGNASRNRLKLINASAMTDKQIQQTVLAHVSNKDFVTAVLDARQEFLEGLAKIPGMVPMNRTELTPAAALMESPLLLSAQKIGEFTYRIVQMKDELELLGLSSDLSARLTEALAQIKVMTSA